MAEKEPKIDPDQEMYRSVDILQSLQDCYRFEQDKDQVRLIYRMDQGRTAEKHFEVEDFYKAVDYYYENREPESRVDAAMQRPDGFVDVYSPMKSPGETRVVARIRNYMVPQILEFAYLMLRQDQLNSRQK